MMHKHLNCDLEAKRSRKRPEGIEQLMLEVFAAGPENSQVSKTAAKSLNRYPLSPRGIQSLHHKSVHP